VISFRRRLRLDERSSESGLSLIEIMVSMLVFAIIMLGVGYSVISTLKASKDGKGREVALNLAAQEIDAVRAISDIFSVVDGSHTTTVPGDSTVYTITRATDWVTSNGTAANCGSGSGTLQYKEVNVSVTWDGMIDDNPVRADTIVAPKTTINDPALGTILVSVKNAAGIGVPGVTISTSPSTGTAVPKTDADGCAYLLKVPPATYTVTASLSQYIDVNQITSPMSTPLVVTAGSVSAPGFAYDQRGAVTLTYAKTYAGTPKPSLPNGMLTSFSSTIGGVDQTVTTTPTYLYPASGYTVVAGGFAPATQASPGCLDVDPSQWPDGQRAGKDVSSPDPTTVAFPPGGAQTIDVPMATIIVNTGGGTQYLTATATTPPSGSDDPGCAATPAATYTFGPITPTSSKVTLALPYGTYTIKNGSSLGNIISLLAGTKITAGTGFTGFSTTSAGVITLDPRVIVP
jgi:type II secretory pathway pseudopilin PulG